MKDIIIWWSAGITSAVSAKLAINMFGKDRCRIIYFDIKSAHKDNLRFIQDCEKWYGLKIEKLSNPKYKDQFEVISKTKYVNGAKGARCTSELKRQLRETFEKNNAYTHQVFGFEYSPREIKRANRIPITCNAIFPLIDAKLIKNDCIKIVLAQHIAVPKMYELGYPNNNCIGCVKGGMGYWNKIRVDFPNVFEKMAVLERKVGRSCLKDASGERIFLDTLAHERGNIKSVDIPDCGFFCGDTETYI